MSVISSNSVSAASPQRFSGAALVLIAIVLIIFNLSGTSMTPNASSLLLLAVLAIATFAVYKTPSGITSLIGLLFLATVIFIASRPLFALLTQDDSIYTITFGASVEPAEQSIHRLLAFWTTGISSLFGGYFLAFDRDIGSFGVWSERSRTYCKQGFIVAFVIVAALLPVIAKGRFSAFASGGYTALYMNQAQYSFDITRLIDFLVPLLYALAVIIDEKRYSRMMVVAVVAYILTGALVGRRMEAGSWLLVALWHFSTIRRNPITKGKLLIAFGGAACSLEFMELMREGTSATYPILVQFFISQGITFMVPGLAWQLPPPPIHAILGSFLPLGALYNLLHLGNAETSSIGVYVSSHSNPLLFQSGSGLGSSAYLEIFYFCGQVLALYAAACGLLGFPLRKWEARASRSRVAMFFFCACISSLFAVTRGSLNTLSSQIIYLSAFMFTMFLLSLSLALCRSHKACIEDIYDES